MAFMISKGQPSSFSEETSEKLRFNTNRDDDVDGSSEPQVGSVSNQLSLKSSPPRSLDKDVVLRRLRHHKTMIKVKNAFQAVLPPHPDAHDQLEKWLQQGDSFTSP